MLIFILLDTILHILMYFWKTFVNTIILKFLPMSRNINI